MPIPILSLEPRPGSRKAVLGNTTRRSGSPAGSDRTSTWSTSEKVVALFAPIPSAIDATAARQNPLLRRPGACPLLGRARSTRRRRTPALKAPSAHASSLSIFASLRENPPAGVTPAR